MAELHFCRGALKNSPEMFKRTIGAVDSMFGLQKICIIVKDWPLDHLINREVSNAIGNETTMREMQCRIKSHGRSLYLQLRMYVLLEMHAGNVKRMSELQRGAGPTPEETVQIDLNKEFNVKSFIALIGVVDLYPVTVPKGMLP